MHPITIDSPKDISDFAVEGLMNCARLNSLSGIGLMLVGAMAYALPESQNPLALLPAIGGVIIATAGIALLEEGEKSSHRIFAINALVSLMILTYLACKIIPDVSAKSGKPYWISDIALLIFSLTWLIAWGSGNLHKKRKKTPAKTLNGTKSK